MKIKKLSFPEKLYIETQLALKRGKFKTAEEIAKKAGMCRTYFLEIVNGRRNASHEQMVGISRALGLSLKELFPE